jgi:hypothetical protein
MSTIAANTSLIGRFQYYTQTTAAADDLLSASTRSANARAWGQIIDYRLIEWGKSRHLEEEEGIEPLSAGALEVATTIARTLQRSAMLPPSRVVRTGDGGIAFEWEQGDGSYTLKIGRDNAVEGRVFNGGRLTSRQHII